MGQILHGCATTTEAIRRAIQNSQASLRAVSKRYGINPKTVAKWKKRGSITDLPTEPRESKSTVLSIENEAIIVAFHRHTLLPLDDCLYALQATIPHLTRSSLHRCLQRHGIPESWLSPGADHSESAAIRKNAESSQGHLTRWRAHILLRKTGHRGGRNFAPFFGFQSRRGAFWRRFPARGDKPRKFRSLEPLVTLTRWGYNLCTSEIEL